MTTDELLTVQQVADRLKIHIKTVYLYINRGAIPAIKLEGLVRVRASDLEKFLNEHSTMEG